ncbi:hypothetical protein GOA99_23200 [Sinorhizobium meliloti]|uniref:hypothetical protein n=1 Tax=Rhizobium meliloti TaxID=382 RepID=UPI00299E88D7|nr:hypothetical protein [Sinorhizobium meliloti]MDW9387533.1 hypothetical protein [Sinorhizobium meliloti]MDW9541794.1 hypothetical protein [Sinorhizobium meliloti]MDW9602042.1 hypothetical protein [Sinorhizobium meliloti]MDX0530437.1 hypothetical protein [Sinorhizobium medicae]
MSNKQAAGEHIIRAEHPDGEEVGRTLRTGAVYLWADKDFGALLWRATQTQGEERRPFFYHMEYDDDDVLHIGDLTHYTRCYENAADEAVAREAARLYWGGLSTGVSNRIEILVTKAKVVSKVSYSPEYGTVFMAGTKRP